MSRPDENPTDASRPGATIADVWRSGPPTASAPITVRQTRPEDFAAVRELQRAAYPAIEPWSDEQFASQVRIFPEGQMVAEHNGVVIGASASLVVAWDDYGVDHTWNGITGGGFFTTHDPAGRTLYGAEVVVNAKRRGHGIGRTLYKARRRLCERLNLRRIIAAGRLPGYREVKDVMSPELYAMRVVWGDIPDPVLRFQMSQGFHYCGVIHNYLPEDGPSCGNAALIVWLNPRYAPPRPVAKARRRSA
ncbi:MAG: GNAT family N-acetyltransferase [Burkholderiales bacterium]